jgi:hypothetical protein
MLQRFFNLFSCVSAHTVTGDTSESTKMCIICYNSNVENTVSCCKKPICIQCWNQTTNATNQCPHCRKHIHNVREIHTISPLRYPIYSRYAIIGNPFEPTHFNLILTKPSDYIPASNFAQGHIGRHDNKGNIHLFLVENTEAERIPDNELVRWNIKYYDGI